MAQTEFWMRPILAGEGGKPDYTDKFGFGFFYANTTSRWWSARDTDDPFQMIAEIENVKWLKRMVFDMIFKHVPHIYLKEIHEKHTKFTLLVEFRLVPPNGGLWLESQLSLKGATLTDYRYGMDHSSVRGEVDFESYGEVGQSRPWATT